MSKRDLPKIDLTLLKKLVSELEIAVSATQDLPTDKKEEVHHFITELSKALGLAASVAQEASLLTKDMYRVSAMAQQPAMPGGSDLLAELFGGALPAYDDPEKKNRN